LAGYGNVAPVTFWGRAFCVGFALVGIPLTLSVIADLGKLIASSLGALADQVKQNVGCVRKLAHLVNPGITMKPTDILFFLSRVSQKS
jgi:Ion channel